MEKSNEPVIELANCDIYQGNMLILNNVNLTISGGEFVYLIGKTGSGKSSLLKTIYGTLPLKNGNARVAGFDLKSVKPSKMYKLRRSLGMVFQDFLLLNDRSISDNLRFALRAMGWKDKTLINNRIEEALESVGLKYIGHKYPHELSGGEQQRVAIARAILNKPKLLIADEPTGNLDPDTADDIMQLILKVSEEVGTSVLFATHDYRIISKFPAKVIRCEQHTIKQEDEQNINREIQDPDTELHSNDLNDENNGN